MSNFDRLKKMAAERDKRNTAEQDKMDFVARTVLGLVTSLECSEDQIEFISLSDASFFPKGHRSPISQPPPIVYGKLNLFALGFRDLSVDILVSFGEFKGLYKVFIDRLTDTRYDSSDKIETTIDPGKESDMKLLVARISFFLESCMAK